jgi:transcriptional regulator with XRE-family HTH domain
MKSDDLQDQPAQESTDLGELAAIGASLRSIRRQRKLTLREVERESSGEWKAVVVGSYERGDRALTLKRAVGLASFYGVPLDQLLGLHSQTRSSQAERITFNLSEIRRIGDGLPEGILRYLQEICRLRSDWNGSVLTLRSDDLTALGVILNIASSEVLPWARAKNLTLAH